MKDVMYKKHILISKEPTINFCYHWQGSDIFRILDGYLNALKSLLNTYQKENFDSGTDTLIYPFMFNLRHLLEVTLKSYISLYNSFKGISQKVVGHDIRELLNRANRISKEDSRFLFTELKNIDEIVLWYNEFDNEATGFKYPSKKLSRDDEKSGAKNSFPLSVNHENEIFLEGAEYSQELSKEHFYIYPIELYRMAENVVYNFLEIEVRCQDIAMK